MSKSELINNMKEKLADAIGERDSILTAVAPLRVQEEEILHRYYAVRDELQAVRDKIAQIEGPERLAEASRVIALCARAGIKLE
ncbi:MAG: hypothetical protein PHS64_00250 [Candidatus Omnitrophica bacterium]|nr:hypothetical protein [Candidatus Omnitrophota bacterium]